MNKVFKVIWSEARNAYVVVSEIAKNHGSKSCSTKKLLTMLIATGVMTCASMAPAMAATNVDSNANVTVKKGATVTVAENATVTVGDNAIVLGKGTSAVKDSVAIGNGASVVAGNNGSSGVALGNNAHAGYKATSLGSNAISGREGTTLVGANTNSGSLYTTVVGTDSVINSDGTSYKALGRSINVQGAAATVVGSKNTVDNKNGKVYSGVANNVMGSANTIEGSNGVTIQGIGNKVTDAYKDMNIGIWEAYNIGKGDYSALAKKKSGAVAIVGGANTVSKQTDSTVIGYDNKLTGDKEKGSQNVFMAGSHNTLTNVSDSLVMGNDNTISDRSNVISFGYKNAITANNAVAIGNGASVSAEGGVALGAGSVADRANAVSVGSKDANRQIINVAEGKADTDAVNVSQLKDVKAEALKHSTVTNGANITVTEGLNKDGGKEYNVALNNDIHLFGDNDAMVSISGSKGTIWTSGSVTAGSVAVGTAKADGTTPFFVDSNGAFYAADSKFSVDKDGNANANSVQTNALNAKYNLSVGTANENGTVPFFVNSNGAFYAANGKLVVDKDGKVTATEGEIGNVVLDNGVFTGHSALRDGELLVGDASGNYSQITTKGAKLGKVTVAADGKISGVAAGAVTADSTDAVNGSQLHAVATEAGKHSKVVNGSNINVEEFDNDGQKIYKVNLNKDIMLGDLTGKYVNISGTNGTIETTGYIATKDRVYADKGAKLADIDVTGNKISNGASSIVLDGSNVKVNDKVTIDQNGKISGVAAGELSTTSKDAVNGSQLYATNQEVANNTNRINKLGSRVNKVGAGAAALAALHPMDFDPDDKLTFSAGYGNYAGENAAAIGAYYRPDEKVMFSVAGTVGNGENMVNAGVSFALDRTNHVSNSRTALAREVIDLRGQLAVMGAKMAKMEKAFGMLDETKTKLFPDVPANHWAYEYIAKLAGNGYIEGYPDGNFGGDRLMTRYEFAAMLYRAIENGAALEEKIIKEFEPELGRIRVDRISGEDGDRDKIERVRVNDTKGERDHYGNKLAK